MKWFEEERKAGGVWKGIKGERGWRKKRLKPVGRNKKG